MRSMSAKGFKADIWERAGKVSEVPETDYRQAAKSGLLLHPCLAQIVEIGALKPVHKLRLLARRRVRLILQRVVGMAFPKLGNHRAGFIDSAEPSVGGGDIGGTPRPK